MNVKIIILMSLSEIQMRGEKKQTVLHKAGQFICLVKCYFDIAVKGCHKALFLDQSCAVYRNYRLSYLSAWHLQAVDTQPCICLVMFLSYHHRECCELFEGVIENKLKLNKNKTEVLLTAFNCKPKTTSPSSVFYILSCISYYPRSLVILV